MVVHPSGVDVSRSALRFPATRQALLTLSHWTGRSSMQGAEGCRLPAAVRGPVTRAPHRIQPNWIAGQAGGAWRVIWPGYAFSSGSVTEAGASVTTTIRSLIPS